MQQKPLSDHNNPSESGSDVATAVRRRCRTTIQRWLRPLFQWAAERLGYSMVEFNKIQIVKEHVPIQKITYSTQQRHYVPDEYIEREIQRGIAEQLPIEIYRRRVPHGYYPTEVVLEVRGEIFITRFPRRSQRYENESAMSA